MAHSKIKIFDGGSNTTLAREISEYLDTPMGKMEVSRFADGETYIRIDESVRGVDVFIVQPTLSPVNENLMRLLIMTDAMKRASAKRITAVVPYFGYARQERKTRGREPITAKLVANLMVMSGMDRVLAVDLHEGAIQGFFDIPFDHASAIPIISEYFSSMDLGEKVIVSPDAGGTERARFFAKRLRSGLAIIDKRRSKPNESEVMNVIGDINGKTAIIVDDIIDTAGTLVKAAEALKQQGATRVFGCATHPVFSPPALERIEASVIEEVVVANTIPMVAQGPNSKIRTVSVAPLLGELIFRINRDISVSDLFI
ncbi:MAG: ribose-phosphate pyrophosphokinase [Candidatus Wallbacteria bacterium HGW-Wallbacteria-1]|jgi:ribose-phosphate pyrophosphokinase|uniref:Ribose-phosphate pyrophosphokinase n=1 Tax=Candidatus Wallbacteria bacterium HGW-Wallbacteria-1 TaxID=2013854 RepID=A0A2N1PUP0_9BACT|nr:MAG: ribose-phosphate pyrophosphokinase [Candidatus Wallbacteria bacterium HGW-Wallbacteria-1]